MSIEELLKPRIKVMVDFPQWSSFTHKKGDILVKKGIHFVGKGTARSINEKDIEKYPEILRLIDWWEERDEKDMPEYVKWKSVNSGIQYVAKILEIKGNDFRWEQGWETFTPDQDYPATKEEYEKYAHNLKNFKPV